MGNASRRMREICRLDSDSKFINGNHVSLFNVHDSLIAGVILHRDLFNSATLGRVVTI
jgi:hypothetical protein